MLCRSDTVSRRSPKALLLQGFFLGCLLIPPSLAARVETTADTSEPLATTVTEDLARLAAEPGWRALLRPASNDPQRELAKTLTDFRRSEPVADNAHALCRFPARAAWLRQQRPALARDWAAPLCTQYDAWLRDLAVTRVTLVFASDYANNPSSLFGHTLLRLDSPASVNNELLAYAINFSADSAGTSGMTYLARGMTGGFAGRFSLLPYYQKVREYNDLESRDLWQYELDLRPEEALQLARVYWDWRHEPSPYFFLSDNCAYQLLGLLDAVRPELRLQASFTGSVIPADTIRAVVAAGLVKRVSWRPSGDTRLDAAVKRNRAAVNATIRTALQQQRLPDTAGLPPEEQAQALETTHDALIRRFQREQNSAYGPWLRQLLVARSRLDLPDQRPTPPTPATRPDQGHGTQRLGLSWQQAREQSALLIHYSPAYHDALDPAAGYRPGLQVSVLDTVVRLNTSRRAPRLGLERFTLLGIATDTPAHALAAPLSWQLRLGADRHVGDAADQPGRWYTQTALEGSVGVTHALADTLVCTAGPALSLRAGNGLSDGWAAGAGANAICRGRLPGTASSRWQAGLQPRQLWPSGRWVTASEISLQAGFRAHDGLRLSIDHEQGVQRATRVSLGWFRYF